MSKGERNNGDATGEVAAVIITKDQHSIREGDIEKEALKVLYRLRDAGFSGYLVGGGVRDLYLGNRPKDFDISTNAHPGQLRKLFRNSRTIGRRFRLVQVFFHGNKIIEVATLRCKSEFDINDPDKVLPSNNTFGTLEEDAFRRDLTINSLFYEIEHKTIIDYVGGVQDLNQGVIRIVGDPERRITRDPVRMLRAIRHAARNGFTIEEKTWQAIVNNRQKLELCPSSRIRDELLKDLQGGNSRQWAAVAFESKVFYTLFPFYEEMLAGYLSAEVESQLFGLLTVIDRLHGEKVNNGKVVMSDYMLFAVLLFPWIERKFDLFRQEIKGPAHHRLARDIRSELNELFSNRLNIKRMAKDIMTTLFVNIPAFVRHEKDNSWPARMRKKSYFKDCVRFHGIWQEAQGNRLVDVALFVQVNGQSAPSVIGQRSTRRGVGRRSGGTNPAFSQAATGVFGLRKS